MRKELLDASEYSENPEAFIAGAQWMERYLFPENEDILLSSDELGMPPSSFSVLERLTKCLSGLFIENPLYPLFLK